MFKKRNRAWLAVLLAVALVAGLTTQASATTAAPDRPTGLTAELNDGGVLLSWDAPDETVDSWQVWRKIHPAETAHTLIATVDGELNEWTDTDLTAGDRRYKVAAVRDSLTSRLSRVAKLMIDEPPPPTPGTITQVPEEEPRTVRGAGDTCTPDANIVTATLDTWTNLASDENWVQVTLSDPNGTYQIYVEATESGSSEINFVCGPDEIEIGNTRARPGTGLGSSDASLNFFTPSAAGLHYVKVTLSFGGKRVLVSDRSTSEIEPIVDVGDTATGTIRTPTDTDGVEVPMEAGSRTRSTFDPSDTRASTRGSETSSTRAATGSREPAGVIIQIIHRPAPPSSGRLTPASSTTTPAPATRRGSSTPRPRPETTSSSSAAAAHRVSGWATGA